MIISKNRIVEHIFLLRSISSLRSPLTLRKNLGNFPVSFGRERALYQLIGSKKAQIQTLRDHIKKSNRRTYFSLWSISSLGSPLTLRKNLGNFPVSFGRERALYQLIGSKKTQIHTLRDIISKNRIVEHIFLLWSILSLGYPLTLRKNFENFPVPFGRERVVSCIIAKISNVQKKIT